MLSDKLVNNYLRWNLSESNSAVLCKKIISKWKQSPQYLVDVLNHRCSNRSNSANFTRMFRNCDWSWHVENYCILEFGRCSADIPWKNFLLPSPFGNPKLKKMLINNKWIECSENCLSNKRYGEMLYRIILRLRLRKWYLKFKKKV